MKSRLDTLIELLHASSEIALATHSLAMPGYPYSTAVAFAVDEHHCPLLLISRLAEHTQNLAADHRASLAVAKSLGGGEIARASLVGELRPIDADSRLVERYLRYHPAAERFLQLGDFMFHRFEPLRVRVVGGFGHAGWLDGKRLVDAPHLSLEAEAQLLAQAAPILPEGMSLLGLDAYGADTSVDSGRRRIRYPQGPLAADALPAELSRALQAQSS